MATDIVRLSDVLPDSGEKAGLKALDTYYGGILFRSRLEARWAVFFDELGIQWEYEPEGFDFGRGRFYLPDFWLPEIRVWIEIKPVEPNRREIEVADALAKLSGHPVYLFHSGFNVRTEQDEPPSAYRFTVEDEDFGYQWCQCGSCGRFGIQYQGRADRMPCKDLACPRSVHGDKGRNATSQDLLRAYQAGRAYQFR